MWGRLRPPEEAGAQLGAPLAPMPEATAAQDWEQIHQRQVPREGSSPERAETRQGLREP